MMVALLKGMKVLQRKIKDEEIVGRKERKGIMEVSWLRYEG